MNAERFKKILSYSRKHKDDVSFEVKRFLAYAGLFADEELLNVAQIARSSLKKKGYLLIEIPFSDKEIGAVCYNGEEQGYVMINSSLPKANVNFAICHELYHVFSSEGRLQTNKVEFVMDHYYECEEEYAANLFAGTLLMPEIGFRNMYYKFKAESEGREIDTVIRLMQYYQVPYMAALIRCYELELMDEKSKWSELMQVDRDVLQKRMEEMWLDLDFFVPSGKDDYFLIERLTSNIGIESVQASYMKEAQLKRLMAYMKMYYSYIKEK